MWSSSPLSNNPLVVLLVSYFKNQRKFDNFNLRFSQYKSTKNSFCMANASHFTNVSVCQKPVHQHEVDLPMSNVSSPKLICLFTNIQNNCHYKPPEEQNFTIDVFMCVYWLVSFEVVCLSPQSLSHTQQQGRTMFVVQLTADCLGKEL